MRAVVQRVTRASVTVGDEEVGHIGAGLVVLVGVAAGDGPADLAYMASKIRELRVFADDRGRMNRSVVEAGGAVLVVSQFTLLGDVRKGRRPAFDGAASGHEARAMYEALVRQLKADGLEVATGRFQAHMHLSLDNDGPVTVLLDSRKLF